jgi:hypothetical protein
MHPLLTNNLYDRATMLVNHRSRLGEKMQPLVCSSRQIDITSVDQKLFLKKEVISNHQLK